MTCTSSFWAHVFMTACLLWITGCVAQKVYYDCGAKVDLVDVQGLILSPGFPYNYTSGTHCVWQFFVPVGHQLALEIFDFDVFEGQEPVAQYSADSDTDEDGADADHWTTVPPGSLVTEKDATRSPAQGGSGNKPRSLHVVQGEHGLVQEQSIEVGQISNSAKKPTSDTASAQQLLPAPAGKSAKSVASPVHRGNLNQRAQGSVPSLARGEGEHTALTSPVPTDTDPVSPETQQSVVDACPHDVLYISDLLTFASRFCGTNRPSSSQLVFGSSQEMVEVIMELITTTHWGRGFALLFHYHNQTELGEGYRRHAFTPAGASKVDSLLAAVSGAAFFAVVLTSALCIIFRPKFCPKSSNSGSASNSEVQQGVQNSGADVSELQLVSPNQPDQVVPAENNKHSLSVPHAGYPIGVGGDLSQNAEVDLSSNGLTELDLGADEVFIISSVPSPSSRLLFPAHPQRERFLRHSDTCAGTVTGWPSPDPAASPTGSHAAQDGLASCARPRAWSVRTFQDFLHPLPQLHKKWCSWNSASPFTKLVDSAPSGLVSDSREEDSRKIFSDPQLDVQNSSITSDSSMSNASYPLTQPAQRQRRLNSASNLRRSRFTGPCFGLLSASGLSDGTKATGGPHLQATPPETGNTSSGLSGISCEFPAESDHVSVPVFAICEEEDRQPLVLAEHLAQRSMMNELSRGLIDGKGPVSGGHYPGSQSPANGPLLQRGRSEWRPWGSQASGGASPHLLPSDSLKTTNSTDLKSAFAHGTANQIQVDLNFYKPVIPFESCSLVQALTKQGAPILLFQIINAELCSEEGCTVLKPEPLRNASVNPQLGKPQNEDMSPEGRKHAHAVPVLDPTGKLGPDHATGVAQ
ncbi:hypothetical protein DPEC_G00121620 [Dallia pectoralis]|uniref:Uncharacterized protein n=1 Tax=Dallia pectoralis TaxID=75939 RepID=A0ACC2GQQ9_DALPE|nr:hypothetical protein DPEC_G00121620 [Dallia pectoralis]